MNAQIAGQYQDMTDTLGLDPLPTAILVLAKVIAEKTVFDENSSHHFNMALKDAIEFSTFAITRQNR